MKRIGAIFFPHLIAAAAHTRQEQLAAYAEAALAFGPTVSFCADTCITWVDITGCAHLHASAEDASGERTLSVRMTQAFTELTASPALAPRVAIAPGPALASMFARALCTAQQACIIDDDIAARAALSHLSVHVLQLDQAQLAWLRGMGIDTLAHMRKVPRSALAMRLGLGATLLFELLEGVDRSVLRPHVPEQTPKEHVELEEELGSTEALAFVLRRPLSRLVARVRAQEKSISHLTLDLTVDAQQKHACLEMSFPSPLGNAEDVLSVLRLRLERMQLAGPITSFTLTATQLAQADHRTAHLFDPVAKAEQALPRLVAELAHEIGASNLGLLSVVDSWRLADRSTLRPLDSSVPQPALFVPQITLAREPARLLSTPQSMPACPTQATHLLRVQSIEWWKRNTHGPVDWLAAWMDQEQALAHVETHPLTGHVWLRGWMT